MLKRIQTVNSEPKAAQIFVRKNSFCTGPDRRLHYSLLTKSEVYLPKPATTHMHFRQQMLWGLVIDLRQISSSFSSAKCKDWIPIKSDSSDICWRIQTFIFIGSYELRSGIQPGQKGG